MTERATVSQAIQIGVESTPGTGVAANKLLNSLALDPGIMVTMQDFRPTGQKYSSIVVPGQEWQEANVGGVASYSELIYMLSSVGVATTGVQNGVTTAYDWTFIPAARTADTVKTFTVEHGDATRAEKWSYGLFTELQLKFERTSGITMGGKMLGQKVTDGITMTASPTSIEVQPILTTDVDVFMDTTSGGLGTTKLNRAVHANITIGNRFAPVWVLNSANGTFTAHVETVPKVEVELLVEADAQGMGLLTSLRAGTTQYVRVQGLSANLAGTALPYRFQFDVAGKANAVTPYSDSNGIYAIGFTFTATYDPAWGSGQAWQAAVRNKQTAL